jgi:hypothetical protein
MQLLRVNLLLTAFIACGNWLEYKNSIIPCQLTNQESLYKNILIKILFNRSNQSTMKF